VASKSRRPPSGEHFVVEAHKAHPPRRYGEHLLHSKGCASGCRRRHSSVSSGPTARARRRLPHESWGLETPVPAVLRYWVIRLSSRPVEPRTRPRLPTDTRIPGKITAATIARGWAKRTRCPLRLMWPSLTSRAPTGNAKVGLLSGRRNGKPRPLATLLKSGSAICLLLDVADEDLDVELRGPSEEGPPRLSGAAGPSSSGHGPLGSWDRIGDAHPGLFGGESRRLPGATATTRTTKRQAHRERLVWGRRNQPHRSVLQNRSGR